MCTQDICHAGISKAGCEKSWDWRHLTSGVSLHLMGVL